MIICTRYPACSLQRVYSTQSDTDVDLECSQVTELNADGSQQYFIIL